MKLNLAFYGGSFRPPHDGHRAIVKHLLNNPDFKKVYVKACGYRPDKPSKLSPQQRKDEIQEAFPIMDERFVLDLSGVDRKMVPTWKEVESLRERFSEWEIQIVCGTDLFEREDWGGCEIQRWSRGEMLFHTEMFYIIPRPGSEELLLPPHYQMAKDFSMVDISSSEIRAREQPPKD